MSVQDQLFVALTAGDFQAAEQALADGADVNKLHPHLSVSFFFHFMASRRADCSRWLAEHGADVQATDGLGNTVLMVLLQDGRLDMFQQAVELGVDIDKANDAGVTPLIRAALASYGSPFANLLLDKGVNVNAVSIARTTALLAATHEGRHELVARLFDQGADPTAIDQHGQSLIYSAVQSGSDKMLKLVLERSAGRVDPSFSARGGSAPISLASEMGSITMVVLLMRAGADLNVKSSNRFHQGITPLMILAAFDASGEADLVGEAIAKKAKVGLRDNKGSNVIDYACRTGLNGKKAVFEALLAAGLDPLSPTGPNALSPLHLAMMYEAPVDDDGNLIGASVEQVIQALVDLGFPTMPLSFGELPEGQRELPPPVVFAMARQNFDGARLLLKYGTQPNEINDRGVSILHQMGGVVGLSPEERMAMQISKDSIARTVAQVEKAAADAEKAEKAPSESRNAKRQRSKEQAEQLRAQIEAQEAEARVVVAGSAALLSEHGADWNTRGKDGITPSMAIAKDGGTQILGQVARFHGADLALVDDEGRTAADYAFLAGQGETLHAILGYLGSQPSGLSCISSLLLNAVYDSPDTEENEADQLGAAVAARFGVRSQQGPSALERRTAFLNLLKTMPADPLLLEARDADGNTPLIVAAATGQDDVVDILLAMGANYDAQNNLGETALIHAAMQHQSDIVRSLRAMGADESLKTNAGAVAKDFGRTHSGTQAAFRDPDPAVRPEFTLPDKIKESIVKQGAMWEALAPGESGFAAPKRARMF